MPSHWTTTQETFATIRIYILLGKSNGCWEEAHWPLPSRLVVRNGKGIRRDSRKLTTPIEDITLHGTTTHHGCVHLIAGFHFPAEKLFARSILPGFLHGLPFELFWWWVRRVLCSKHCHEAVLATSATKLQSISFGTRVDSLVALWRKKVSPSVWNDLCAMYCFEQLWMRYLGYSESLFPQTPSSIVVPLHLFSVRWSQWTIQCSKCYIRHNLTEETLY